MVGVIFLAYFVFEPRAFRLGLYLVVQVRVVLVVVLWSLWECLSSYQAYSVINPLLIFDFYYTEVYAIYIIINPFRLLSAIILSVFSIWECLLQFIYVFVAFPFFNPPFYEYCWPWPSLLFRSHDSSTPNNLSVIRWISLPCRSHYYQLLSRLDSIMSCYPH